MTKKKTPFKATSADEVAPSFCAHSNIPRTAVTRSGYSATDSTAIIQEKHLVHWFRKGLRLHDNPSLLRGLQEATTFRCVFVIDPWFAGSSNVGINKWR